jgi:hypothetical protein
LADYTKDFTQLALTADLITDELKATQKVYWEYIQTRANALKKSALFSP